MFVTLLEEGRGRCILRNKVQHPSTEFEGKRVGKMGGTASGQENGKSCPRWRRTRVGEGAAEAGRSGGKVLSTQGGARLGKEEASEQGNMTGSSHFFPGSPWALPRSGPRHSSPRQADKIS